MQRNERNGPEDNDAYEADEVNNRHRDYILFKTPLTTTTTVKT